MDPAVFSSLRCCVSVGISFLRFAPSGAVLPRLPVAELLHFFVEGRFFQQLFHFYARQTLAERLSAVANPPAGAIPQRGVHFHLPPVHLIALPRSPPLAVP